MAITLTGCAWRREKAFIAFAGLKGAVPVLLAAFAILGGVPDGARIYDLVFVAVLVSVVAQGSLVPAGRTGLGTGCTWETGCRGSCRCASAASRRGRTSSASRRARTPMARR